MDLSKFDVSLNISRNNIVMAQLNTQLLMLSQLEIVSLQLSALIARQTDRDAASVAVEYEQMLFRAYQEYRTAILAKFGQ